MTIQELEDQKKAVEAERFRIGSDGHSTLHLDNRVHDIDRQIEALRSKPQAHQHGPTDKQIAAKQRELNAQTEKSLGGITFHHSRREAETEILLSTNSHAKKIERTAVEAQRELSPAQIAAKARAEVQRNREEAVELSPGGYQARKAYDPEPYRSIAQWASAYEVDAKKHGAATYPTVAYARDGQVRFVDRGNNISIKSNDERSVKDAVSLAKEKWGNVIQVNTVDPHKREAIMRAMAGLGMKLNNNDDAIQKRFLEIAKEVERQKVDAQLVRPQRVEEKQGQLQTQGIAP